LIESSIGGEGWAVLDRALSAIDPFRATGGVKDGLQPAKRKQKLGQPGGRDTSSLPLAHLHRLFYLSHPRKKESSGVKKTIGKEFNQLPGLGSPSLDCFL